MHKLPEGQLSRAGVVSGAALKLGARSIQKQAKKPFRAEQKLSDSDELFDEKTAQILFDALTKLKGTAVKLAQLLSMEVDVLPEKFQQELAKSYNQVPPLNRVLVNKVIMESFGQPAKELFNSFDTTAFAAASLGQVHAATSDTNEKLAVKIQYPGIHVATANDIKLLKKIAVALPNRKTVSQTINEVEQRLMEELDYSLEAKTTQWFHDNMTVEGIEVPRVYHDRCNERVLCTQLLEGEHLTPWLATNPSQQARNLAAQRLYDQFVYSTRTLKRLHADPNPGNFLFRDDGSLGLIDFGCVKTFSDNFVSQLPNLIASFIAGDRLQIYTAYEQLGMSFKEHDEDSFNRVIKPFGHWISKPFLQESFDFGEHSDYTSSARDLIHNLAKLSNVTGIAEEFIFFDRTVYGQCKIFEQMQATVRMRHHWIEMT